MNADDNTRFMLSLKWYAIVPILNCFLKMVPNDCWTI